MDENNQQYKELLGLKQRLHEKVESLRAQLQESERQLESVTTTLALLGYAPLTEIIMGPMRISETEELKSMTQIQAMVKLAERNHGKISVKGVKRIFLSIGLIKNPKNANNIIFNAIQRSERFQRVAPGTYELIDAGRNKVAS